MKVTVVVDDVVWRELAFIRPTDSTVELTPESLATIRRAVEMTGKLATVVVDYTPEFDQLRRENEDLRRRLA